MSNVQQEELGEEKKALRLIMQPLRAEAKRKNPLAGQHVRDLFCLRVSFSAASVVGIFKSIGQEIDTAPLIDALQKAGCTLALPVIVERGQALIFRRYVPGDVLVPAVFGVEEPSSEQREVQPDIVVTPFLAFDAKLYRLGYGGGFYDRTLQKIRQQKQIEAIGIGYGSQQVPHVPRHELDARLDKVITETQIFQS